MKTDFQPNFVAYATAHGKEPQAMLDHDSRKYPGGCMCGFILWISQMKSKFFMVRPDCFLDRHAISNYPAWENFLQEQRP